MACWGAMEQGPRAPQKNKGASRLVLQAGEYVCMYRSARVDRSELAAARMPSSDARLGRPFFYAHSLA